MSRTQQFLEPGPGPAIPVGAVLEQPRRDLHSEFADRRVEVPRAFPMCVYSVPNADGTRDLYVACGCGWFSLPLVTLAPDAVLCCEACDARRQGAENFARWFAPSAAVRGCHVERQVELKGAA